MNDPRINIGLDLELDPHSQQKAERDFRLFQERMSREMGRRQDRYESAVGAAMFGSQKNRGGSRSRKLIDPKELSFMEGSFKKSSNVMVNALGKVGDVSKKIFNSFSSGGRELDKIASKINSISAEQKKLEQAVGQGGGLFGTGSKNTPRTSMGQLKRGAGRAAGFIGGSVLSMLGGAYNASISAYEQYSNTALNAAPQLMNFYGQQPERVGRSKRAKELGYSPTEELMMQKRAASMGLGLGTDTSTAAMEITRALGEQGLNLAASLKKRAGSGELKSQLAQIKKDLSSVFAAGLASGLEQVRVPELLNAANQYAEQQIAITPTKDNFKDFAKQIALLSSSGVAGLQGARGGRALSQIDQAIKGASGAQQSLALRAFGFGGGGTSYFEALKRQEKGVGDARNLPAIMEQLMKEYGANSKGGLSEQGLLAFKRMGFGSLGMGEEFSKIYLEQKAGKINAKTAEERINKAMQTQQESQMPQVQLNAYKAMASFGKVSQNMAARMEQFVEMGPKLYGIKDAVTNLQIAMVKDLKPVLESLGVALPPLIKTLGPLAQVLGPLLKDIAKGIGVVSSTLTGFFQGASSYKGSNPFGSLASGAKGAMNAQDRFMSDWKSREESSKKSALKDAAKEALFQAQKEAPAKQIDTQKTLENMVKNFNVFEDTDLSVHVVLRDKDKLTYEQVNKKVSRQKKVQQGARPKSIQ